jgi:transcription elongation factor S-II
LNEKVRKNKNFNENSHEYKLFKLIVSNWKKVYSQEKEKKEEEEKNKEEIKIEENSKIEIKDSFEMSSYEDTNINNEFLNEIKSIEKINNKMRDFVREKLPLILYNCKKMISEEQTIDIIPFSLSIENEIFNQNGKDSNSARYKNQYRSIKFNLEDESNPEFRRSVLTNQLFPEEIANLTSKVLFI